MQSEMLSGSVIRTNTFGVYTTSTAMPQGCMYICFQTIVYIPFYTDLLSSSN